MHQITNYTPQALVLQDETPVASFHHFLFLTFCSCTKKPAIPDQGEFQQAGSDQGQLPRKQNPHSPKRIGMRTGKP